MIRAWNDGIRPRRCVAHALVRTALVATTVFAAALPEASNGQTRAGDPQRLLAERFSFSQAEITQARSGQPVAKMIAGAGRDELAVGGAIRLDGDKNRVATWVQNIAHFRHAADLGLARVVDSPPTTASFADLTLDATDLADLQKCTNKACDLHLPVEFINDVHAKIGPGTSNTSREASALVRALFVEYAKAYLAGGDAALGNGFGDLLQRATTLFQLAPAFAGYLQRFPSATLDGVEQRLYWSSMPAGKASIVSLHHLVTYRPGGGDIVIADKTIYATRYFDAGGLVISLQDAADGRGYYLIAASRMASSDLTGVAGSVLRRQIQRSAVQTVEMYLGWLKDSLAQR